MNRLAFAVAVLALLLPLPAMAQTSPGAYDAVRQALYAVWDELPLTVRNATLTAAPAVGYGEYEPRDSGAFVPGETIHVYGELLGYGVADNGDGTLSRRLAADLTLLDAEGAVRATSRDFFTSETRSRQRTLETYLTFTATLTDFEPGDYVLRYDIRDLAGGKSAAFELPVTLGATPAP